MKFILALPRYIWRKIKRFWYWYLHTSWKKRIIVSILLLVLLFIFKRTLFPSQKQNYTFDTVSTGTITQLVTENGSVIASSETDVYSPANGVLSQIYVHNGDHVSQGQKLFSVQSTATAQEQAVAYASYLEAQSTVSNATATLNSLQSAMFVANQKFVTDRGVANPSDQQKADPVYIEENADWLQAEANYKNQQAVIAQAQAGLTSASLAYQATQNATVTAPTSGTVANIVGLTGAKVIAEVSSSQANATTTQTTITPVLIIGNTEGSALQTTVSEVDVNKVSIGQQVDITFSAIPNKTYEGEIKQIDTFGTATQGVVTYNVFITVTNPTDAIRPGMSANLTINTAKKSNVLSVANGAIVPYQNGKAVQVVGKNGKITFIPVIIGLRGFARSEVLHGVTPGEKVILGNTQLTNNQSGGPGS